MKRYIVQGFMTMFLFAAMLSMRVSAASGDEFRVDGTGGVTLVSDHAAAEGVSSLQFSLTVEPDSAADVSFEFYGGSAALVTGSYYNADEKKLNVYMAGTKALFQNNATTLPVGRVVVQGGDGKDVPATVSMGENSLQYVYGSELKNMEGMEEDSVAINSGDSGPVTTPTQAPPATQVPPATEAPQPTQEPPVTQPPASQAPPTQAPVVTQPPAVTQEPPVTQPPAATQEPQTTQAPATEQPQPTNAPGDSNGSQGGDNGSQGGNNGSQAGDNGSQGGDNGSQGGDNGSQGGNGGSQGGGSASKPKATTPPKKVVSASSGATVKPQGTTGSSEASESDSSEAESSSPEAGPEPEDIIEGDFGLEAEGSVEDSSEEAEEPRTEKDEKGLNWIFVIVIVAVVVLCAAAAAAFMVLKKKPGSSRDGK